MIIIFSGRQEVPERRRKQNSDDQRFCRYIFDSIQLIKKCSDISITVYKLQDKQADR